MPANKSPEKQNDGDTLPLGAIDSLPPAINRAQHAAQSEKKRRGGSTPITEHRHADAKRKNLPAAGDALGSVEETSKIAFAYDPHRTPALRFFESVHELRRLLDESKRRALTSEEAEKLAALLEASQPWLEWTGKREQPSFEVEPVALHIHERVSAQAILRAVRREDIQRDLFADTAQSPREARAYYQHDIDWTNRLITGDSLQVMTSLSRRENLAGQVQMIYMDPPYGIKFSSNWQNEVGKRDVKDKDEDLCREPEMIRAYRDTWALGVHSYLAYLKQRLIVARELLKDSGSIFVQISDENLHRVRCVMDEVFGAENFVIQIAYSTTSGFEASELSRAGDYILWYAKKRECMKYIKLFKPKEFGGEGCSAYSKIENATGERTTISEIEKRTGVEFDYSRRFDVMPNCRVHALDNLTSQNPSREEQLFEFEGKVFLPGKNNHWKANYPDGMNRLKGANRIGCTDEKIGYIRYFEDHPSMPINNMWTDTLGQNQFGGDKLYVVQTGVKIITRCLLMTTSPGDLVLDPTCGSGTSAYVAEQWGRRWITIDTSRVAVAIARQRLLTACFETYKTRDPSAGADPNAPQNPAFGFYYKTVPHITLKSIAQNKALDAIFARHEPILAEKLAALNTFFSREDAKARRELRGRLTEKLLAKVSDGKWSSVTEADKRRWILPDTDGALFQQSKTLSAKQAAELRAFASSREKEWQPWQAPFDSDPDWPAELRDALAAYRAAWRAKMDEVNAAIAANADQEELVDQPEVLRGAARVSGPFTVESMRPPETSLKGGASDAEKTPIDGAPEELPETFEPTEAPERDSANAASHIERMLGWLRHDGVTFLGNKHARFTHLDAMDGSFLHGEGEIAAEGGEPRRVAAVIGPEFGSVTSYQVENALRDAFRRGYDDLIFAGFSFDAQAQETIAAENDRKGAKMRLHMAQIRPDVDMKDLLKKTNKVEQIFTVFGQPRTSVRQTDGEYVVRMEGVDLYNPLTNALDETGADKVAAWFVDTDYDGKVFCVCQAFFPDKTAWDKIARALKTGVEPNAFAALSGTESLPFKSGQHERVAVKVIDPRGNEVMRVHSLGATYAEGGE